MGDQDHLQPGFRIYKTSMWVGLNEKNGALRIGEGAKDIGPTAQKCKKTVGK